MGRRIIRPTVRSRWLAWTAFVLGRTSGITCQASGHSFQPLVFRSRWRFVSHDVSLLHIPSSRRRNIFVMLRLLFAYNSTRHRLDATVCKSAAKKFRVSAEFSNGTHHIHNQLPRYSAIRFREFSSLFGGHFVRWNGYR